MDKKEIAQNVVKAGGGLLTRIGKLMPRGGVRSPDSLVRNRDLYVGGGNFPSPIIGRPLNGKALLTGHRPTGRKVTRRRR